jgi:hypothetical protein
VSERRAGGTICARAARSVPRILPKLALVAQWLDVGDVIGATLRKRLDVILGPGVLVSFVGPRGHFVPAAAATRACGVLRQFCKPFSSRMASTVLGLSGVVCLAPRVPASHAVPPDPARARRRPEAESRLAAFGAGLVIGHRVNFWAVVAAPTGPAPQLTVSYCGESGYCAGYCTMSWMHAK